MPAKVLVLYNPPTNPDAFNRYYFDKHIPLAKTLPGLRAYRVNDGPVGTPMGGGPYHLVAELDFDSVAAVQAALGSAEGRATGADVQNFATGGATILIYETKEV